jgi:hypothetical protein
MLHLRGLSHKLPSFLAIKTQNRLTKKSPSTILLLYKACAIKKRILEDYQKKFGKDSNDSIVTRKQGKISDDISLNRSQMRPSLDKWYRVGDLHLYNVITTIIKESRVTFSKENLSNLRLVNKDYATIVPKVIRWLRINFTPLREPQLGYENQKSQLLCRRSQVARLLSSKQYLR